MPCVPGAREEGGAGPAAEEQRVGIGEPGDEEEMTAHEFGRRCQKCKKRGGDTFARTYYKPIDGKWLRLCSSCWKAAEEIVQVKKVQRKK